MKEETNIVEEKKRKSVLKRIGKGLLWLFLGLFILLFLVVILIQFPAVQNWGAKQIAKNMSRQMETEVRIDGGFQISFFDELTIGKVLIRDLERDTAIYAGHLTVTFDDVLKNIRSGKLVINKFELEDAIVNNVFLNHYERGSLGLLFGKKTSDLNQGIKIEIKKEVIDNKTYVHFDEFVLRNTRIRNYHEVKGKEEHFYIPYGYMSQLEFEPSQIELIAHKVEFDQLEVKISNFKYDEKRFYELFVAPWENDTTIYEEIFPFSLDAKFFDLKQAKFTLDNYRNSPRKISPATELDWSHLRAKKLNLNGENVIIKDWGFAGKLNEFSFETSDGFKLDNMSSTEIFVSEQQASLKSLNFLTGTSNLKGDIKLDYSAYTDFRDFSNKVMMDLGMDKINLSIKDLLVFAPKLKNTAFFSSNKKRQIRGHGKIIGRLNRLKSRGMKLSFDDLVTLEGSLDIRDVTTPENTIINLDLKSINTDLLTLRKIVPNFNLPENFDRLGELNFAGSFNGLLKDFVAYGNLKTDLGSAEMDMRLDFSSGVKTASYSGQMKLENFQLGTWSGDDKFGMISAQAEVSSGKGLTEETADANLDAVIKSFNFKNYTYHNAHFNGRLNKQLFSGKFDIKDENIDLNFDGLVEFSKELPKINATGNLEHLDAQALNLTEFPIFVSTDFDIDIVDIDPDNFTGDLHFNDISIGKSLDNKSKIDSLFISSRIENDNQKEIRILSDILEAEIIGNYRLLQIPSVFTNYLARHNKVFAQKLGVKFNENVLASKFKTKIHVNNTLNLFDLVPGLEKIDTIKELSIDGEIDDFSATYSLNADLPVLHVDNLIINKPRWYSVGDKSYHNLIVSHEGLKAGKINLAPLNIFGDVEKDSLYFVFNETDFESFLDQINIEGKLYSYNDLWQIELYDSNLQIFGNDWQVNNENYFRFGKSQFIVNNLNLNHKNEFINVSSVNDNKGLNIDLKNLPLGELTRFIQYDKLLFEGEISGGLVANDIKNLQLLNAHFEVPELLINKDSFGIFSIDASSPYVGSPIALTLKMDDGTKKMNGIGSLILKNKEIEGSIDEIDFGLNFEKYPLAILEYFITNGLSNTKGEIYGQIVAKGPLKDPIVEGRIDIPTGSMTIDLLGVEYSMTDQTIRVNSDMIDLSGAVMTDQYGNEAIVEGGLTHHNLAKLGLDARIYSNNILVLNTDKKRNPLYYGKVFGSVNARFDGDILTPRIVVDAKNNDNSNFTVNTDYEKKSAGLDFIEFKQESIELSKSKKPFLPSGVDFILNLTVTEDGKFQFILDETTRDIITAEGIGDLILHYSPSGELELDGIYEIQEGKYNFPYDFAGTIQTIKTFNIKKGSSLKWLGDPYNAIVDIHATYENAKAAPYNLISDQIFGNAALESEALQKTDVHVNLFLRGEMLKPEIDFSIELPSLSGSLKAITDQQIAALADNKNDLNNQVAFLIGLNDFTSIEGSQSASAGAVALATTVSEWLSNQLSYYLDGLLASIISNIGFIDDIEFDVGYRLPSGEFIANDNVELARSEVGAGMRLIMANRRLELNLEGDYINNREAQGQIPSDYVNANVELDYILTSDKRWRLRAFSRADYVSLGRRSKSGIGINWSRSYDNLEEYAAQLKDIRKKNREEKKIKRKASRAK